MRFSVNQITLNYTVKLLIIRWKFYKIFKNIIAPYARAKTISHPRHIRLILIIIYMQFISISSHWKLRIILYQTKRVCYIYRLSMWVSPLQNIHYYWMTLYYSVKDTILYASAKKKKPSNFSPSEDMRFEAEHIRFMYSPYIRLCVKMLALLYIYIYVA